MQTLAQRKVLKMKRQSGVLLHISSLPGPYGIGDLGKEAYNFVDFLKSTGTSAWQILPLGITGYGDSPYQSFSAFAGNPYFIDLKELVEEGFLTEGEIKEANIEGNPNEVDFAALYERKMPLLRKASKKASGVLKKNLAVFYRENKKWLKDFATFMAIKDSEGGRSWKEWKDEYKYRDKNALKSFIYDHKEDVEFWIFTQYYFFKQWNKLKKYANENNIQIIGDIPIYVAEDGADIWSHPEMFKLDSKMNLTCKAGCPPDAFSEDGQLWGNPIYNWKEMKKDRYSWWIERIRESFKLYDVVRIDHFRGFESYWEIEGDSQTAKAGKWVKGPGMDLFKKVKKELGELNILAEDLGFLTEDVEKLIEDTGFPGMKVMVFAFDSREDSDYLPHNYEKNTVVYTSNHDTQTARGYINSAPKEEKKYIEEYFNLTEGDCHVDAFIRGAWSSVSYLAVTPMQDLLNLGDKARFNIPSTLGGNWMWRMRKEDITQELTQYLKDLNRIYRRL